MRKRRQKTRADTRSAVAYYLGDEEILPGYTPLRKNKDVIKCTNKIADLVSNMTIMLMANGEGGDMRIKNNLSRRIDITPCSFMGKKNFIFKIVKDMLMNGNALVYPEISGSSIENLIPLDATAASYVEHGNSYKIIYKGVTYEPDELLHFVLVPEEGYPFRGEGYKRAVIDTVSNLAQEQATRTKFLRSKWKPSIIVSVDSDIEEFQEKDKRKNILKSYLDTTEEGEPWIIPAGQIDVKTVQPLTLNDLAVNDSIVLDKKDLASAFDIPPFLIGVGEFNKDEYNNFISTKIMSIATIIQQELTKKLLISNEMYFRFNPKSLMQYDLKDKTSYTKEMVAGGMMSRNEGRNEFDLSPVDKPGMNDYIVLENYIPVEKVGDQKKLKDGDNNE